MELTSQQRKALREHYAIWSGGFPPESEYAITVYMDYAVDRRLDPNAARDVLEEWMESGEMPLDDS